MGNRSLVFIFIVAVALCVSGNSQLKDSSKPSNAVPDFSQEAFTVEQSLVRIVAQADGTVSREEKAAIHIIADAGVKHFAVMSFPYTSANQTVTFDYVRVRKPDGTVVNTPDYNIQDMPADVTRVAPMYSDLHEKHVAVKGLGVGDTLEYLVRMQIVKPEIPDHFWVEYNFNRNNIVKDEQLEISVPLGKRVTVSSPKLKPVINEDGGRRIYHWSSSNLERKEEKNVRTSKKDEDGISVNVTTFSTWDEIGRWYDGLQQKQIVVTPAIQAKAAELTKGLTTDEDKLRAIYNFVALRIHYVGLSFGIGRYQPHPAEDVLSNEYGDCKDKHTLLASLLKAAGFDAWPVLINSSKKIDKDAPSPSQFDHLITVIPRGDKFIWLDSTPEVAPFGLILRNLRDKDALIIPGTKQPFLEKTPADPPIGNSQSFIVEGKLTSEGTFSGHIEQSCRGDSEVVLRLAFRQFPQAQWKDLVQGMSYRLGYAGEVSDVKASAIEDTTQPFRFSYEYLRQKYGDWENQRITPPLPPLGIEVGNDADQKVPDEPLFLGSPGEIVYRSKIELPQGSSLKPPQSVDLVLPYAEYHTSHSFESGIFTSTRRFIIKNREVPLDDWEQYRKFRKTIADDEWQFIPIAGLSTTTTDSGVKEKKSTDALFNEGVNALQSRDVKRAQEAFERIIQLDPNYHGAHYNLGVALAGQGKQAEALAQFRKEQEVSPGNSQAFGAVANLLMFMNRIDEAADEYRKLLKADPRNVDAALKLTQLLSELGKAGEAAPSLEEAVNATPESFSLRFALATAYMGANQKEKAVATLREAVEGKYSSKDTDPAKLNSAAYLLADNNFQLDLAKSYAEKAVTELESRSSHSTGDDDSALSIANQVAAAWDTLGWTYFRNGDLVNAESYIRASWLLGQSQVVGDHLGQIYEKQGKRTQAIHLYELALAAQGPLQFGRAKMILKQTEEIRRHYEHLAGKSKPMEIRRLPNGEWSLTPQEELSRMRKIRVAIPSAPSASAEVSIVFTPASITAVHYVSGDEAIKKVFDKLQTAKYNVAFPSGSNAVIVRRATVMCTRASGCDVVLHTSEVDNRPVFLQSQ